MNRRSFFERLASGLIVAQAPALFLPKLEPVRWRRIATSWVIPKDYVGKWSFTYGEGYMATCVKVLWDGERWTNLDGPMPSPDPNAQDIDCMFQVRKPLKA